jgi:hypothetical protein
LYKYDCSSIKDYDRSRFVDSLGFGYNNTLNGCIKTTIRPETIVETILKSQMDPIYFYLANKNLIALLTSGSQGMANYLGQVLYNLTYPLFKIGQFTIFIS